MIIYDIEIVKAIPDGSAIEKDVEYCGGWSDYPNMGIACVGVLDYESETTRVFLNDNLQEFAALIRSTDCIVGFNNHRFDNRLLMVNGIALPVGKSYDILEEVWRSLRLGDHYQPETHGGYSLDALVKANFGVKKTGSGAKAPIEWQRGERGKVIDYCLADVALTRRLLDRIIRRGNLINPKNPGELIRIRKPSPEVN